MDDAAECFVSIRISSLKLVVCPKGLLTKWTNFLKETDPIINPYLFSYLFDAEGQLFCTEF